MTPTSSGFAPPARSKQVTTASTASASATLRKLVPLEEVSSLPGTDQNMRGVLIEERKRKKGSREERE
jgi:hypothetical protein